MPIPSTLTRKHVRILTWIAGIALLFAAYIWGISKYQPGFYLDESATAYNAYLVSRTGAGEFGPRFPVLFQFYSGGFAQDVNPVTIYLLAIAFRFLPPSILAARLFATFWMFAACLLLGLLAKQISRKISIGVIVAATALLTPWLFEVGRLVWDAHFVAFTVVLFLFAAYHAQTKETWDWRDVIMLVGSLTLLTYGYFSGRVLAPLFAFGLLFFATTKRRIIDVVKIWLVYGITLVPILVFNRSHPEALTKRLYEISYIRPGVPWREIASEFVRRYLEDQSLYALLMTGDYHPRHHVQGSGGAMLFATFVLAMIGLLLVFTRGWRDPWWRFVAYGLAASVVPGAITVEPFHELRLMGYAIFLSVLTVPALEWLLASDSDERSSSGNDRDVKANQPSYGAAAGHALQHSVRVGILCVLLTFTVLQAIRFQTVYRRDGPKREFEFDVPYKAAYDTAISQPTRPIYLQDGKWGPAYMHAMWYSTIEGRPRSEFVHLPDRGKAPRGSVVISSAENCQNCEIIKRNGVYFVYRVK